VSLQAFDAVARYRNFTRAATELGVTQAAITQHVKNLEETLGVQLFVRSHGNVTLTEAGSGYLSTIQPSLYNIDRATRRLIEQRRGDVVAIDCLGAFALKRLLPALDEFRAQHQDISFHIRTMVQFQKNARSEFDLAIWHGLGNWPGVTAHKLLDEEIFPVCSPCLLEAGALTSPADLRHHTVIRANSDVVRDDWPFWLDVAGGGDLSFDNELACNNLLFSVQAAVGGLGVAMGRTGIVERDLETGRLIEPFLMRLASPTAYYLVMPEGRTQSTAVSLVREWMLDRLRSTT